MADPTPPSDIPDPSSPTPATSAPRSGPVSAAGPKRVRSMPDRLGNARSIGTIRSVPEPVRGAAKVSGSYVETLSKEKNWGRGIAILWGLFLVTLFFEWCNAACYQRAGKVGWPLPVDVLRIGVFCMAFAAMWSGMRWSRYVLALVGFVAGIWLLTDCTLSYRAYPQLMATGSANWTVYSSIEAYCKVAVGLFSLVTAAYAFFSYDVREFIIHRRERGRLWPALLTTVVVYAGMLLIFAAPLIHGKWMQEQYADAQRFGDETLRAAAERWEPTALDAKLDSNYAKTGFTKADRVATFNNFKALGRVKKIDPAPVVYQPALPQYPLQNKVPVPQGITSAVDGTQKGFELTAKYTTANVDFEHGHGKFGFDLARSYSGQWRIMKLNVETVEYDRPPKPAPTPTPAVTPVSTDPAAPAASPATSPASTPATASTTSASSPAPASAVVSPAASLAPAATPLASSPAPTAPATPAASATPAATPVPSTGG